jgi:SPP1 gp7 family putative phage head morphogenesis protein
LYTCGCEDCKDKPLQLALSDGLFKKLLNVGKKAFKQLHKLGTYKPEDLKTVKEYKTLIDETYNVFNKAILSHEMPDTMRKALQDDAFLFGGLKTHAQLFEASKLLLDDKGELKPFTTLDKEFDDLGINYNRNYLQAEYEFATSSSQMASKWENFDSSGRYNLQYRTAKDNRVREEHAKLADITLPKEDAFWTEYMPPNGWNCRCTVVEVLKDKFPESDSEKSILAGQEATTQEGKDGKNRLAIFRFNPGVEKKVFPPAHPYNKVKGAIVIKEEVQNIPKNITEYEKRLGIKVNKDIFKHLKKETPLLLKNADGTVAKGAYYNPNTNDVVIPINQRRKNSKWYAQAVIHHEFGHAIDFQRGYQSRQEVKDVMQKYKKIFSKNKNEIFKQIQVNINETRLEALRNLNYDTIEKTGACADTIMSLNRKFGYGHTIAYFKRKGSSEAEFIAHVFENKFSGNEVFKRIMPELYDDMIKLADDLNTK